MNKALTLVTGMTLATILVLAGFVLGAVAEAHYHEENDPVDYVPTGKHEQDEDEQDEDELTVSDALKRVAGYPGFTK